MPSGGRGNINKNGKNNCIGPLCKGKENRVPRTRLLSEHVNYLSVAPQVWAKARSKSVNERPALTEISQGTQYERITPTIDNRTSAAIQPQVKKTLYRRRRPTENDIFAPDKSILIYVNDIVRNKLKGDDYLHLSDVHTMPKKNIEHRNKLIIWLYKSKAALHMTTSMYCAVVRLFDHLATPNCDIKSMRIMLLTVCWMVTKMDGIKPMSINEIIRMSENSYSKAEVFSLERELFSCLGFRIVMHDPELFLAYYLHRLNVAPSDILTYSAHFIVETIAVSQNYSMYPASLIAAAAVYMATENFYPKARIYETLSRSFGYYRPQKLTHIVSYARQNVKLYLNFSCPYSVIFMKYCTAEMKYASKLFVNALFKPGQ